MPSSVMSFLAYAAAVVSAGEIKFSSNSNAATLTASCEHPEATIAAMTPTVVPEAFGGVIEVYFTNVAPDCVDYKSGVPCANHSAAYEPQFFCEFTGAEGTQMYGPYSAMTKSYMVEGSHQGTEVYVACPAPHHNDIVDMTGYEGAGTDEVLELSIKYGPANTSVTEIEYDGVPGGNVITFTGLYEPPSPSAPPMPPAAPPPACIETHRTLTWNYQYGSSGGCAYGSWHSFRWRALGSKTWTQCALLASNYGQMMVANAYISYGWHGHRRYTVAKAWLGSWSSYQTRSVTSTTNCYIGRSTRTTTNNLALSNLQSSVDVDGYTWEYEIIGTKYYDECAYYAETHGAMRITPYTVGKTTSSYNWWQQSGHMCHTLQWINAAGTGLGYQGLGGGQRGTRVYCMVGYIACDAS